MSEWVLDASAVLALIFEEHGAETIKPRLSQSILSSVNLVEVISKLVDSELAPRREREFMRGLNCEIAPVDETLALRAGLMRRETRTFGLTLGDRVCLALAEREGLPVLTADRAWAALPLAIDVRLIR